MPVRSGESCGFSSKTPTAALGTHLGGEPIKLQLRSYVITILSKVKKPTPILTRPNMCPALQFSRGGQILSIDLFTRAGTEAPHPFCFRILSLCRAARLHQVTSPSRILPRPTNPEGPKSSDLAPSRLDSPPLQQNICKNQHPRHSA